MSDNPIPVTIHIFDKEYLISCPEEEREELIESARHLDTKMKEVRDGGKVFGSERIAVMTALNVVHEFLQEKREKGQLTTSMDEGLQRMQQKIQTALGRRKQPEAVD